MKYNKGCLWLSYAKIIEEDILIEKIEMILIFLNTKKGFQLN